MLNCQPIHPLIVLKGHLLASEIRSSYPSPGRRISLYYLGDNTKNLPPRCHWTLMPPSGISVFGHNVELIVLLGRAHQGLVSFWEGPWCPRALRNKHLLPYPPLRPSMLPQDSVARNWFGWGKPSGTLATIWAKSHSYVIMRVQSAWQIILLNTATLST
jgi:hypothetical protein